MKKFSIIMIFLLLTLTVFAIDLPSPKGYVNDFAEIFSDEEKQQMETFLDNLEKNTTVEIAVVTVSGLEGLSKEEYAVELFEDWKIGKKDVDNGLLILIAPNEREYRIEVGYGLEGIITDAIAGRIARKNFITNFRAEKYSKGINDALIDFKGYMSQDPEIISQVDRYKETNGNELYSVFMSLLMFLIFLGIIMKAATSRQKKKKAVITKVITGIVLFVILWIALGLLIGIIAFVFYLIFSLPTGKGHGPPIFLGGGRHGGGFSGGFGGFGGGMSGGGGAGGGW